MRLPFEPEPLDALRARYRAAVETVYDKEAVFEGRQTHPAGERAHVFDVESGLRLIVSRVLTLHGVLVEFSASASPGSSEWNRLAIDAEMSGPSIAFCLFINRCEDAYRGISSFEGDLWYQGPFDAAGAVPHWYHAPP